MIISRTPFRISFFGGGTDYPAWYLKNGGSVLVTSINKYCYITCRYLPPFFEHKYRIVYVKSENCNNIDEISHPAVRGILRYLNWDRGLEIHHDGDLPARGGMGSSSSFTVGMLHALNALQGHMPSKKQLATNSIFIEQEVLHETVGSQDQASTAYGGFNHITFHQSGEITVRPITISKQRLNQIESHLMLFYSGIKRTAAKVAESYVNNIEEKNKQLNKMTAIVNQSITILDSECDVKEFGKLLHEAWLVKRSFSSKVTNTEVDNMYNDAISAGALGGKILGAGGGGFMVLFVPPDRQRKVRERLSRFIHVPFKFDFNGSQIIYYDPQEDFSDLEIDTNQRAIQGFRELGGE